jgi:hypothetical protein
VRFYFTNTANTRVFNVALPGAQMKLVGADAGTTSMRSSSGGGHGHEHHGHGHHAHHGDEDGGHHGHDGGAG